MEINRLFRRLSRTSRCFGCHLRSSRNVEPAMFSITFAFFFFKFSLPERKRKLRISDEKSGILIRDEVFVRMVFKITDCIPISVYRLFGDALAVELFKFLLWVIRQKQIKNFTANIWNFRVRDDVFAYRTSAPILAVNTTKKLRSPL